MIRKISTQDVVSKHSSNSEPARRERDFLIERLTRKHVAASIADSPAKVLKRSPRQDRSSVSFFKKIPGNKWIWIATPIILVAIIFIVMQILTSGTVTVIPKQEKISIDTKLSASMSATSSISALSYQIITLNAVESQTVVATSDVPTKPTKASGKITVFNSFSKSSQPLIKNTRFETESGLIYRISDNIVVPGISEVDGKNVPGSITVTVTADQTGSKYNIDMADFTIPGFKTNAERYSKIFARSSTAMNGGSDGGSLGVDEETRKKAELAIDERLKENLLRQVKAQKTANSIIFDSANKISFQSLPDTQGGNPSQITIRRQGTISAVGFDKTALGKLLLSDAISRVGGKAEIQGLEDLHFIAAVSSTSPVWQIKPFSFTLTGSVSVIGVVDSEKLAEDLADRPKSTLTGVLSNYPTIDKATGSVSPFWKTRFPASASKIKIDLIK
jgi:hypothetical protein